MIDICLKEVMSSTHLRCTCYDCTNGESHPPYLTVATSAEVESALATYARELRYLVQMVEQRIYNGPCHDDVPSDDDDPLWARTTLA